LPNRKFAEESSSKYIDPNKVPKTAADKWTLFVGFAGAIKVLLAAPPINIEIEQETIDAWLNIAGFVFIGIAMYRNNRRHK
jgi:hypothetical protein